LTLEERMEEDRIGPEVGIVFRGSDDPDLSCGYHEDEDADGEPCGPRCGAWASRAIWWKDGRWSAACVEHARVVFGSVPELIARIEPLVVLEG
jgi:hypothetical protein